MPTGPGASRTIPFGLGLSVIKVMLCDDHALIRRGIRDTLSAPDIGVVGEAGDYELRALLRQGCTTCWCWTSTCRAPQRAWTCCTC